jgi:hypothetical protein
MLDERRVAQRAAQVEVWPAASNIVRMSGVMRESNISLWLLPLIDQIHSKALQSGFEEVVLDIRALEYANAALWRCLVHWVKRVCQSATVTYKLRILSDPSRSWQQIGVPTLRAFSLDTSGTERLILGTGASD